MERLRREREEQAHPNPAIRRTTQRCDGLRREEGGDGERPWALGAEAATSGSNSALIGTQHPGYNNFQGGGASKLHITTPMAAEEEKKMFPEDSQLPAYVTVDTLRITGVQPDGSSYPLEDSTTTGDLQKSVTVDDVRLRANNGWASHTALVPSNQSLNQRRQQLAETGHIVELPPHGNRQDKLQNHQLGDNQVSEMEASFKAPSGFVHTTPVADTTVEVRFRKGKTSFEGDSGRPEMYNR